MIDRTNYTVEFFIEAPDGTPILAGKEYQWISGKDDYTGLSRVKTFDGKWGIIDEDGKEVLKAEYDSIWKFEGKQRYDTKVIKDGIERRCNLFALRYPEEEEGEEEYYEDCYEDETGIEEYEEERHFGRYAGSYAQDDMGYSDEEIDSIFDGDPSAYWNID